MIRSAVPAVIDTAMWSATNFALVASVSRGDSSDFDTFALYYTVLIVLVGANKALTTEPIAANATDAEQHSALVGSASGFALSLGVLSAGIMLLAAVLASDVSTTGVAVVVLGMPFVLLQDCQRVLATIGGRAWIAMRSDCAWLVTWLVVTFGLMAAGVDISVAGPIAWFCGAVGAAILLVRSEPFSLAWKDFVAWKDALGRPSGSYLVEFLIGRGAAELSFVLAGLFLVEGTLGSIRLAQTAYAPLGFVVAGVVPLLTANAKRAPEMEQAERVLRRGVSLLGMSALLYGAVLTSLPERVFIAVFGESWSLVGDILDLTWIRRVGLALTIYPVVRLRVGGDLSESRRLRLAGGVLTLTGALLALVVSATSSQFFALLVVASWITLVVGVLAVNREGVRR